MYSNREVLGKNATVRRLKSSVTVMTARHPLARLVSAFRDKFADGRKLDKPQSKDHFIYFWSPALKALYRNTNMPLQINFTQFVTFALLHKPHEPHWEPFTKLCSPCDISYQYIIFLDTLTEDLQFLMSALNISTINSKTRDNRGPREGVDPSDDLTLDPDLLQYYLQLPPYLMAKVLHTYTLDIKLLGYQVPEVLNAIAT
ncbi:hypothetical protein Pmani_010062 [Petrolisthes manimaculis]|uniref:Carbohydrate sulfotransferase n=1 Tax=Petrolisthes manimaculis TaxID=1843537 RepID=A0AAE1Q292_9EUCA|nr:hypothetical protein Pmani_010062 [Petrolisthes manimaculis]